MDQPLSTGKTIVVKTLSDDFNNSKAAERLVLEYITNALNIPIEILEQPDGYHPEWDIKFRVLQNNQELTAEVKCTSYRTIKIEFAYADGRPSGISLSKADYYLVAAFGGSKPYNPKNEWLADWKQVCKLRVIPTCLLRGIVAYIKQNQPGRIKTYAADDSGPGALYVELESRELGGRDGWIGTEPTATKTPDQGATFYMDTAKVVIAHDHQKLNYVRNYFLNPKKELLQ